MTAANDTKREKMCQSRVLHKRSEESAGLIGEALLALMEEKPYAQVTVSEICRRATVRNGISTPQSMTTKRVSHRNEARHGLFPMGYALQFSRGIRGSLLRHAEFLGHAGFKVHGFPRDGMIEV